MKRRLLFGGIVGVGLVAAIGMTAVIQTSDLERIHAGIEASYDSVEHLAIEDFAALDRQEIILFDVRQSDEFAVSHLPGAILVDPEVSERDFEELFAGRLRGKRAIFYCSVGVRSSILADRVAKLVNSKTGKPPVNLIGGVFQWRNEERWLVSASGQSTNAIHPFDSYWGRLIEDKQAISYSPTD